MPCRRVRGFQSEAFGHIAAAYSVVTGEVDCCIATRSAAKAGGARRLRYKAHRGCAGLAARRRRNRLRHRGEAGIQPAHELLTTTVPPQSKLTAGWS